MKPSFLRWSAGWALLALAGLLSCDDADEDTGGDAALPAVITTPVIHPPGGTWPASQEITIQSATPGVEIRYSLDGGLPDARSGLYQGPFTLGPGARTVQAIAYLGDKRSAPARVDYTIADPDSLIVHFKRPASWTTDIHIHYWDTTPAVPSTEWPGAPMSPEGDDWYVYTIQGARSAQIVFNDNRGEQTADLSRDRLGWYDGVEGRWYDARPGGDACQPVCGSNARCADGLCLCDRGFEGDPVVGCAPIDQPPPTGCEPACGAHATCAGTRCVCDQGFEGDPVVGCTSIEQPPVGCEPPCRGGQRCVDGACVAPSGEDFREENIYFMMTDRFADGDTNNNNIWGNEYMPGGAAQMYEYNEDKTGILSYYHGGDFRGILENLEYIKEMGFTAIWITPVVKQPEGRYDNGSDYSASAFHGYWGYDFDKIDPHLHSSGPNSDGWDDFGAFVRELHNNDIKLILDIVTNHGHPGDPAGYVPWSNQADTVILDGQTWNYNTDIYQTGDDSTGFFNHRGDYKLSTLLDFNERGEDGRDAREHLKNVYKRFIDYGVDGFRMDTVAYMTGEWWGAFSDEMWTYAQSRGNDNFYMIGEAWMGRNDGISRMQEHSVHKRLHLLDLQGSCMDYPGELYRVFDGTTGWDYYTQVTEYGDNLMSDPTWMGVFVDNHDVYRANGRFNEAQYMNALNYIYLFRGVPIIYYGTEAMYSWPGAHATTNKDDVVARWMLGAEGINHVRTVQPRMYKHIKMLNFLRLSSPALQKGQQEDLVMAGNQAVLVRRWEDEVAYVATTNGPGYSYTFNGIEAGSYRLITPNTDAARVNEERVQVSGGSFTVNVRDNAFVVLERQ